MELIRPFAALSRSDAALAGGKGASLGEMTRSGVPVPPGFVVLSTTFDRFLAETDLTQEIEATLAKVNHQEIHTVEHASETIQSLIKNASMPQDIADDIVQYFTELDAEFVAVRSSATAEDGAENAWAGQLDSFLNTTRDTLLENVQKCWASLFTPRAIFYRFEKQLNTTQISVAVVVQKMIQSEVSGIAFSVHPVTEDRNQLIIEAGYGLGEAIVSGSITPDSYVVEKAPRKIIDANIATQERGIFGISPSHRMRGGLGRGGEELANGWRPISLEKQSLQKLTDEQILELSELVVKIENHYGFPCDIEWAFADGKFFIVQSRPITTLGMIASPEREYNINLQEYQKLFHLNGVPFLVNDILMQNYAPLQALFVYNGTLWESYLPSNVISKLNSDGVEFYRDETSVREWVNSFESYWKQAEYFFIETLSKNDISQEDAEQYLGYIAKLHWFYIKTEFFYTDLVFLGAGNDPSLNQAVAVVEKIKQEWREHLTAVYFGEESYFSQLVRSLSRKFSMPVEDIWQYTRDEILALFDGILVSSDLLAERRQSYVTSGGDCPASVLVGETAMRCINRMVKEESEDGILRGVAAFAGRAVGRARVFYEGYGSNIINRAAFERNFQLGDILVVDTSSPRLEHLCARASALIADQGGLLSHAAIVARELKKPCIIGTKFATQVLHDGDLVEVDADAGVVRRVERASEK